MANRPPRSVRARPRTVAAPPDDPGANTVTTLTPGSGARVDACTSAPAMRNGGRSTRGRKGRPGIVRGMAPPRSGASPAPVGDAESAGTLPRRSESWSGVRAKVLLTAGEAHAEEREVVLHRVERVEPAEPLRDVERHRPSRRPVARQARPPRDREDVRVERDHERARLDRAPDAEVHAL